MTPAAGPTSSGWRRMISCGPILVLATALAIGCAGPETASRPPPAPGAGTGALQIEITTHLGDNQVFRAGDPLSFVLSLERDAYLLVLYRDASGRAVQLLPNARAPAAFFRAGDFLDLPGAGAAFEFRVAAPFGEELVWVFGSSAPLPALPGEPLGNGLTLLRQPLPDAQRSVRAQARRAGLAHGEASARILTTP